MQQAGFGPQPPSWVAGYSPGPSSTGASTDQSLDSRSSSMSAAAHAPAAWPRFPSDAGQSSAPAQSSRDGATAGRIFGLQDASFDLYTPSPEMAQQYGPTSRKWLPWSRTSSAEEYDIEMGLPCPQPHAHQLPRAGKVN